MLVYPGAELSNFHYKPQGGEVLGSVIIGRGKRLVRTYWYVGNEVYMRDNVYNVITRKIKDQEHLKIVKNTFKDY